MKVQNKQICISYSDLLCCETSVVMWKYTDISKVHAVTTFSGEIQPFNPENGGNILLRHMGIRLQDYTVSQPRRPKSQQSQPCKPRKFNITIGTIIFRV
jgi:hypothetical protein